MKSMSAVAFAAALTPAQSPATNQDVLNELSAPVAIARSAEQATMTPPPVTMLPEGSKPSVTSIGSTQDPAPKPVQTPEELRTISQQLRTVRLLEEQIYTKLEAGGVLEAVLREAEANLKKMSTANAAAIGSLEKALADPEKFRTAQDASKNVLDNEMTTRLNERLRAFGTHQDARGRGGSGFLRDLEAESGAQVDKYPQLRGKVDQAAARLLSALQIDRSGDQFIDKRAKPYESDPKLKSALTVSPWMDKPSAGLKPEEIKALYERDRPKTDADIAKLNAVMGRQDVQYTKIMKEQPEPVQARLKAIEKLAGEVASSTQMMESRGIVIGVNYDPDIVARLGYESVPAVRDADWSLIDSAKAAKNDEVAALKAARIEEQQRDKGTRRRR